MNLLSTSHVKYPKNIVVGLDSLHLHSDLRSSGPDPEKIYPTPIISAITGTMGAKYFCAGKALGSVRKERGWKPEYALPYMEQVLKSGLYAIFFIFSSNKRDSDLHDAMIEVTKKYENMHLMMDTGYHINPNSGSYVRSVMVRRDHPTKPETTNESTETCETA